MKNKGGNMNKTEIYYQGQRPEVAAFLPSTYSKVLEIGCGNGDFRDIISNNACEYWGVEPVAEIAKLADLKLDRVLVGTYDEIVDDLPDNYFDLIICNDVIEHMVDHEAFYQSIKQKVKPNAYMIGSLPNVRFLPNIHELLRKKDWEYKESGILDRTHLRFFTEKSIKRDFNNQNFEIEILSGINGRTYTWSNKSDIFMNFLKLLLGKDTEFLQFGFRVLIR